MIGYTYLFVWVDGSAKYLLDRRPYVRGQVAGLLYRDILHAAISLPIIPTLSLQRGKAHMPKPRALLANTEAVYETITQ
jgi:hypothetical protein